MDTTEPRPHRRAPWVLAAFCVAVITFVVSIIAAASALDLSDNMTTGEAQDAAVVAGVSFIVFFGATAFGATLELIRGAHDVEEHRRWGWPRLVAGLLGVAVLGYVVWSIVVILEQ